MSGSIERQGDITHTAGPTPVGKEFIRLTKKWIAQYGVPVPEVVLDACWEMAGFYEKYPDIFSLKEKDRAIKTQVKLP